MRWMTEEEACEHAALAEAITMMDAAVDMLSGELSSELEGCRLSRRESEVQATCYQDGARYVRHVDNSGDAQGRRRADGRRSGRRLTCILYANPSWHPGGKAKGACGVLGLGEAGWSR